jgi:tetratricopeptide (TPR) repeat protein
MADPLHCLKISNRKRPAFRLLKFASILSGYIFIFTLTVKAGNFSFTNSLALAVQAEKRGDLPAALLLCATAETLASNNAANLCALSHTYCDLTYLTNSVAIQKILLKQALACALQAVKADPRNAVAHVSVAVCYAKSCALSDIKTELAYSRLFKIEAEKTIALDPKQDVAYYLLGRWNYGLANVGLLSRTFAKVVYGGLPEASNEEAIRNFKKACELAPNRILNYAGLAQAYAATGQKSLELETLRKCCALKAAAPEDLEAQEEAQKELETNMPRGRRFQPSTL